MRDEWERAGCILDRERLCKEVTAADMLGCIQEHEAGLTEDCKLELGMIKRPAQLSDPKLCAEDREKFCSGRQGVSAGKCLYDNAPRASELCREHLNERRASRARLKKFQSDCGRDLREFCASSPNAEHHRYACLKRNVDQLSVGCKTHIHP